VKAYPSISLFVVEFYSCLNKGVFASKGCVYYEFGDLRKTLAEETSRAEVLSASIVRRDARAAASEHVCDADPTLAPAHLTAQMDLQAAPLFSALIGLGKAPHDRALLLDDAQRP
jgi:hypothetical protein